MGSWIILIHHGIASQPIIEHYSQFVRLARINPKIDRQGQRIIIKHIDRNRANKRNCRRFGEFSSLVHVTSINNMSLCPGSRLFCGIITSFTPSQCYTHTTSSRTDISPKVSPKLIMIMQLINIAIYIYNNHQDV